MVFFFTVQLIATPLSVFPFSFLVGEDGFVYEGVGGLTQGSHTRGYNDLSLGITFIGTFTGKRIVATPFFEQWCVC